MIEQSKKTFPAVPEKKARHKLLPVLLAAGVWAVSAASCLYCASAGTTGAQFLNVPVFARSVALGEAYTGYADDAGVLEYNPAGLCNVFAKEAWISYLSYFGNSSFQSFSVALPYRNFVLGFGGKYQYTSDTEVDSYGVDKGKFSDTDLSLMPAIAYKINPDFAFGCSIKTIYQTLKNRTAAGFAVDMGSYYHFPMQKVSLGAAISNIGPGLKFVDEEDPLPLTFKIGGAWELVAKSVLLLEVVRPSDGNLLQRFGMEYHATEPLWLRIGWKVNRRKFSDYTGLTAGFGLRVNKFYLDYAFAPHSDLGTSHYITTGVKFGQALPLPKSRTISTEESDDQGTPEEGGAPDEPASKEPDSE
jgi:long-subunit fatty acid transport protein